MRSFARSALAVVAAWLCLAAAPQPGDAQNVPDFIEVGKRYVFGLFGMDDEAAAEVLEIGQGAWIKVQIPELEQPVWLNLDAMPLVIEMTPELQAFMEREYTSTRERAYQAAMKADLRNLVVAEEAYFADNLAYTESPGDLAFTSTTGVTIEGIELAADGNGWAATATHAESSAICAIYVGSAEPPMQGMEEGVPVCR